MLFGKNNVIIRLIGNFVKYKLLQLYLSQIADYQYILEILNCVFAVIQVVIQLTFAAYQIYLKPSGYYGGLKSNLEKEE
jgi:hypothetical protein